MILRDRIGDGLQQHRLTGTRRRNDKNTLTLANRRYQINYSRGEIFGSHLHLEYFIGIEWRQVVKEDLFAGLLRRLEVNRFDLNEREIALAFFGRPNLTADGVAGA